MGKPTLLMVGDIPVVLPAPFDELPPIRQALVIRREREIGCAMGRGDKVAAARIALELEDRMGITMEQRVAVMQPADKIDAMIEQALVLGMTGATQPPRRRIAKPTKGSRKGDKPKRASSVMFHDGPTAEREAGGDFRHEPQYAVVTAEVEPGFGASKVKPARILKGYVLKDKLSEAETRLRRYSDLDASSISAGVALEREWTAAGLEPKMVSNLLSARGGKGGSPADSVIDARTKVHYALEVLKLGGDEVVRVVIAVVVAGESSVQAGTIRYADAEKGRAHVAALLKVGLTLLARHYRIRATTGGKNAARNAAKTRILARQRVRERA